MRLSTDQIQTLKALAAEEAGPQARLRLFGSRLNDAAKGGDVDLLLELDQPADNVAWLAARLSARASLALDGRKVDVLVSAPDLMRLPIHEVAFEKGVLL